MTEWEVLQDRIIHCNRCKRLRNWCRKVAREKVKRYRGETYWGKPLPGFGDPKARVLIVGLAPAAHGGNRTGRMFTGDGSAYWLMDSLYKSGFANQSESTHLQDGLQLVDCYITATARCAPPQNQLRPSEIRTCRSYLLKELELLKDLRVIVGLGKVGFDNAVRTFRLAFKSDFGDKPKFGHGVEYRAENGMVLVGAYHPSQRNTLTGKLSKEMMDQVFRRVRMLIGGPSSAQARISSSN